MDSTAFFVFLFIHLASLIVGFGSVLVIDTFGILMMVGKTPLALVKKVAETTQKLIWVGWSGMVFSGLFLITMKGYVDNLTKIKIFLVLLIGLNGIFLHQIKKYMDTVETKKQISPLYWFRIGLTSAISQTGWWGALFIGFIHRHIEHNIAWPTNPYPYIFGISGVFILAYFIGESFFKAKR